MPPSLLAPLALLVLGVALSACADDDGNNGLFDGNFIVGDAASSDLARDVSDFGPKDSGSEDADLRDQGPDLGAPDLGAPDVGVLDEGVLDLGPRDTGPDPCLLAPEETLTASVAVQQRARLDGRVILVVGELDQGRELCTERACTKVDPCCNTCTASLLIDGALEIVPSACLPNVGCSGDECGLVCRPAVLGAVQGFLGRLHDNGVAGATLEVIELRRR